MVGFNLLPNREWLLAVVLQKWRRIICAVFLITSLFCLSLHFYLTNFVVDSAQQEALLQMKIDELRTLEKDISGDHAKRQVLMQFHMDARKYLTHTALILSLLSRQAKKTVCFTSIVRLKHQLVMQGYALSAEDLLLQLKRWQREREFTMMNLSNMHWLVHDNVLQFEVTAMEKEGFTL